MDPVTAALNLATEIIKLIAILIDKTPDAVLNARIEKLFAFFDKLTAGWPPHLLNQVMMRGVMITDVDTPDRRATVDSHGDR